MLKFYRINGAVCHNGVEINRSRQGICLCDESKVNDIRCVKDVTWENVEELDPGILFEVSFNLWNTKKGRILDLYNTAKKIKEWKEPLNITVEIFAIEFTPSMKEIFEWDDAKKASQYLKEQNLL